MDRKVADVDSSGCKTGLYKDGCFRGFIIGHNSMVSISTLCEDIELFIFSFAALYYGGILFGAKGKEGRLAISTYLLLMMAGSHSLSGMSFNS